GSSGTRPGTGSSTGSTSMTRFAGPILMALSPHGCARGAHALRSKVLPAARAAKGTARPLPLLPARELPDRVRVAEVQAAVGARLHREDPVGVREHHVLRRHTTPVVGEVELPDLTGVVGAEADRAVLPR